MRKIIQTAVSSGGDSGDNVFALCDDGTIWFIPEPYMGGWIALPPIPQDELTKSTDAIDLEGGL